MCKKMCKNVQRICAVQLPMLKQSELYPVMGLKTMLKYMTDPDMEVPLFQIKPKKKNALFC